MSKLDSLGWGEFFESAYAPWRGTALVPGRVATAHAELFEVLTETGPLLAERTGKLRQASPRLEERPAVGDWVVLRPAEPGAARGLIEAVLPRRTSLVRRAAGDPRALQVLAANLDTLLVVMGLDANFNLRRLERVLVLAWESGAEPVVLLNKADVCDDVEGRRRAAEAAASGVPVLVLAARERRGLEALAPYLRPGRTLALVGSSGVGKSTLVNALLGEERQRTGSVREQDQRGRHTTSRRELVALPGGALLVDTPGLRELALSASDEGLDATFGEVARLAESCRFRDCRHEGEPGCAVAQAVARGQVAGARLESYRKLRRELEWHEKRADPEQQRAEKARWRTIHKAARRHKPRE